MHENSISYSTYQNNGEVIFGIVFSVLSWNESWQPYPCSSDKFHFGAVIKHETSGSWGGGGGGVKVSCWTDALLE